MGLADKLDQKPSSASAEAESTPSATTVANMDLAPEARILVFGAAGSGKTSFCLSVTDYWDALGLDPEQTLAVLIDADAGAVPLFRKGAVPKQYASRVHYQPVTNWREWMAATEEWLPRLKEHQAEHGRGSAWGFWDNTQLAWQWARDQYALDVFGKPENEIAKQRRKEARSQGKSTSKSAPTFIPRADYGVINGMHARWAETVKLSGINFVWTAPERDVYEDDEKTGDVKPGGQKDNPYRVHEILRLYEDDDGHKADAWKTREGAKRFRKMPDPSIRKLIEFLEDD